MFSDLIERQGKCRAMWMADKMRRSRVGYYDDEMFYSKGREQHKETVAVIR